MRVALVSCSLLALGVLGCSPYRGLRTEMASSAIQDYNTVQADTQSALLARNILRAKDRLPRHFTGLGTGQVVQQTTAGISPFLLNDDSTVVNVGTATAPSFKAFDLFKRTASLALNVQSTPRIDLAALDSKEFITGMTSTVRYDVLHYFQRQGWASHLMMLLFVRELQLGPDTFRNYPGDVRAFRSFVALTKRLAGAGLALKSSTRPPKVDEYVGPTMCLDQVGVLEHQVTAAQNGLKLFEAKGDTSCAGKPAWGLGKPISDNYWSFDACRLIPTDGAELELMFRSQIESAWISALDPKIVTRDATVDAVLVDWRKKIADASGKCGPGSCDTRPISSVQDYAANNSIDRYESLCSHLKDYQAIRQGRCPDQWKDGHCANGFPTVAAEVSLNASTDATKFAISGKALLRSPESIIYYLGQVVRAQDLSRAGHGEALHDSDDGFARYWDNNGTSPQEYALMSLKPVEKNVDDNASAVLAVEHGDTTYAVVPEKVACVVATPETAADPNSGCDRSMGVVNAVLMLIGLQRSATELPTTPTVNVVGGG